MTTMNRTILLFAALIMIAAAGCKDFVQSVEAPNNSVADAQLNDPTQTMFVVAGVEASFDNAYAQLSCMTDGLSDQLVFDTRISTATYPTYLELETGNVRVNNGSVEDAEKALGQLRLYADTLVARVPKVKYVTAKDSTLRQLALFTGYFYGGIARYFYGAYFGITQDSGGGCINLSPFIPSTQMYALALAKLNASLQYATPDMVPVVNTLIARIELLLGDYAKAATAAAQGMQSGANDFRAYYSTEAENFWWGTAGNGRLQFVVDQRFPAYIAADPKEVARLPLTPVLQVDSVTTLYEQAKYPDDTSSIAFATWQENELILAECAVRGGDNTGALTHINNVRTSHGLDTRTSTTIDSIYIERDKELFCTGARLMDERRFNRWHLPAGTWEFLPVTQLERTANSNLH